MALFVSVWAACTTMHNIPTLNGIIASGQKTSETSKSCRTLTCSSSYLTSVTAIKGLVDVNQYCKPATGCKVIVYRQVGTQYTKIGEVAVPCGSSFSTSPKTITLPANTYPCNNETYCVSAEVTLLNSASSNPICGISYTSGSATFNCN